MYTNSNKQRHYRYNEKQMYLDADVKSCLQQKHLINHCLSNPCYVLFIKLISITILVMVLLLIIPWSCAPLSDNTGRRRFAMSPDSTNSLADRFRRVTDMERYAEYLLNTLFKYPY